MTDIQKCDRCGIPSVRRYLWTVGVGINPTLSWELCRECNEAMIRAMAVVDNYIPQPISDEGYD